MARRLAYYAGASAAAAAACLLKAAHQRPNFYSATVYLSQSNACMLILTNLLLVTACWALYGLQRLLYGPLRPIEIEQLSEKAWYAVLDTLLAMPSFREDVGGWLLTMFVLLLAGKVWGWIAEGRVDILEQQPPADPRWFHARLATSLLVSVGFDLAMFRYCCKTVIHDPRPGMMVIFTFEFAILSIFSLFTLCRYLLSVAESQIQQQQTVVAIEARKQEIREERAAARQAEAAEGESNATPAAGEDEEPIEVDENEVDVPGWEEKRRYLFALEVITDFVKLLIYLFFFVVSVTFNGLPMHIMRDVYMTFTAFSKRVADYVAYRRATSHMNTRYPDATSQEIQGDVCIICRETMLAWEQPAAPGADQHALGNAAAAPPRRRDEGLRAKKLPCGHILHLRCLKAWLERQQVCPTCRRPVVSTEASSANGGAARPGAGANDAGAANQGQQGQPAANQQPGRDAPARRAQGGVARMFNLGPLRIGFLNGPQEQVQNLMNQLQNPAGRPAAPAAAPPHDLRQAEAVAALGAAAAPPPPHLPQQQRGGQHLSQPTLPLGLSPLHNSQAIPPPFLTSRNRTAGAPSRAEQFNSVEQFIMQEAQNIRLEQLQLSRIAALYDELAQLRDQHDESNGGGPRVPTIPASGNAIPRSTLPTPSLVAGSGGANQTMSNGHEGLPAGLVLPEGWTLTPLFPVGHGEGNGGAQAINANAAATTSSSAQPLDSQDASSVLPPTTTTTTPANQSTISSTARDTATSSSSQGPTDEHGSPLFLPTLPQAAPRHPQTILTPTPTIPLPQARPHPSDSTAASHPTSTLSSTSPAISPPGTASSIPQTRQSTAQHPPAQGKGTHDEDEDEDDEVEEEDGEDEDEDEDDDSEEETKTWSFPKDAAPSNSHPSSTGKGKAKAVEVEDAEDPEA